MAIARVGPVVVDAKSNLEGFLVAASGQTRATEVAACPLTWPFSGVFVPRFQGTDGAFVIIPRDVEGER